MKNLRDYVHNELQNKALKNAFKYHLDNIGTYMIDNNGNIVYRLHPGKIDMLEKSEFIFPNIEQIISKAKSLYKDFECSKFKQITYIIEGINFYRRLVISAPKSNIIISKCKLYEGLSISDADNIDIIHYTVSSRSIDIKSERLTVTNFGLVSTSEEPINIMTNELKMERTSIDANDANVNIDSEILNLLNKCHVSGKKLCVGANKMNFDNSTLRGIENIDIHYKEDSLSQEIEKIYSKTK